MKYQCNSGSNFGADRNESPGNAAGAWRFAAIRTIVVYGGGNGARSFKGCFTQRYVEFRVVTITRMPLISNPSGFIHHIVRITNTSVPVCCRITNAQGSIRYIADVIRAFERLRYLSRQDSLEDKMVPRCLMTGLI